MVTISEHLMMLALLARYDALRGILNDRREDSGNTEEREHIRNLMAKNRDLMHQVRNKL